MHEQPRGHGARGTGSLLHGATIQALIHVCCPRSGSGPRPEEDEANKTCLHPQSLQPGGGQKAGAKQLESELESRQYQQHGTNNTLLGSEETACRIVTGLRDRAGMLWGRSNVSCVLQGEQDFAKRRWTDGEGDRRGDRAPPVPGRLGCLPTLGPGVPP